MKLVLGTNPNSNSPVEDSLTLTEALHKIDRVFGIDQILKGFDSDTTIPYYTQSEWGYRFYHSAADAIHMALSLDGMLREDDYYAQPRIVADRIRESEVQTVLEVGCGKGFNTRLLATQFPAIQFIGIDLTPLHIQIAQQKSLGIPNLKFQSGDFNQLDFPDGSVDLVFAFECLCHAQKPVIPLGEIFRILRPGGQLILFDGYRQANLKSFSKELQTATRLTEVSMAVQAGFAEIEKWLETATSIGFDIVTVEDLSFAIQPTLNKIQDLSSRFFHSYWRSKIITQMLPKYLVRNSIAGLLMPLVTDSKEKPLGYYQVILHR